MKMCILGICFKITWERQSKWYITKQSYPQIDNYWSSWRFITLLFLLLHLLELSIIGKKNLNK